jgi:hypothetical protein
MKRPVYYGFDKRKMEHIKTFGISICTSILISQLREKYISKHVKKSEISENKLKTLLLKRKN